MTRAYVLLQAAPGQAGSVARAVGAVPGVSSTDVVSGPYDVIAEVEAANMDDLGRMILASIQGIPGVRRTLTCPVVRF